MTGEPLEELPKVPTLDGWPKRVKAEWTRDDAILVVLLASSVFLIVVGLIIVAIPAFVWLGQKAHEALTGIPTWFLTLPIGYVLMLLGAFLFFLTMVFMMMSIKETMEPETPL